MSEPISDARRNTLVERAIRQAEETAADDDRAFLEALRTYAPVEAPASGGGARSLSLNRPRTPRGARLDEDPRYLANVRALARRTFRNARIIGGSDVRGSEFDACVAVGDDEDWGCTGALIAPDVVLTAVHCEALHTRVFVGNDVSKRGRIFRIRRHVRHPRFSEQYRNDLMLLFLERKVTGVTPRPIASAALIDHATDGHIVGFGTTNLSDTRGYGIKRQTDVPIVSQACRGRVKGKSDGTVYGCHAGLEIVAGQAAADARHLQRGQRRPVLSSRRARSVVADWCDIARDRPGEDDVRRRRLLRSRGSVHRLESTMEKVGGR